MKKLDDLIEKIKHISYIIEDEGYNLTIEELPSHGGNFDSIRILINNFNPLARCSQGGGLNFINIYYRDLGKFQDWIKDQDFYQEYVDRLGEICDQNGFNLEPLFQHKSAYLKITLKKKILNHLLLFESFFDEEIKIALDEEKFAELCRTGYVKWNNGNLVNSEVEIPVEPAAFDLLVDGKAIKVFYQDINYKIAISDMGYDTIWQYVEKSNIY